MSKITCTRRLEIDAGHRLVNHGGKCQNTHGHRYRFDVSCAAGSLDDVGRVIDFSEVKRLVGGWLDENWDHGFIYQGGDRIGEAVALEGQKTYRMSLPPTAENLAAFLLNIARGLLAPKGIEVVAIRCYETPNCWADAT